MTTSLYNAEVQLSKDLGDYWAGTTTGAGSNVAVVDTALMAKANDWVTNEAYDFVVDMTGDTYNEQERKISSLDNSTGTLTVLAHGGALGSGASYRVHRLWSASDKRTALIQACKLAYPFIYTPVRSESYTANNWLLNGDVETWTSSSYPDYWRVSGVTATATTTAKLFTRGSTSCKLDTATGYLYQDWTYNDDLKYLRGRNVTLRANLWCDTASALRLAINDGTTTTYSDYHAGDSAWNEDSLEPYVTAQIAEDATNVSFRVYLDSATATGYVDNLRVFGPTYNKIYVGNLSLDPTKKPRVYAAPNGFRAELMPVHNVQLDLTNGFIYIFDDLQDSDLVIEGMGYLDFLKSGATSTAWDSTVAVNDPQLRILTSTAALWLYSQRLATYTGGEIKYTQDMIKYWQDTQKQLILKFRQPLPLVSANWGINQ